MRPSKVSLTGTGTSAWIPCDIHITPFNIGLGCVVTGTATYTIEHTFDDVQDATVTPTAFPHSVLANQTANQDGNYAFPVKAVRLHITAGTGTVALTVIQAGI
jgi:hypothetical protein